MLDAGSYNKDQASRIKHQNVLNFKRSNGVKLSNLFEFYQPVKVKGDSNVEIINIATHSSKVKPGGLFFAFKGAKTDGHNFIGDAVSNGSVSVVTDRKIEYPGATLILVKDLRLALSRWAAAFYGFPANQMDITGVTGTNGKTTITNLIYRILLNDGKAGLIGTSGYLYDEEKGSFGMTTPHAHDLHFVLSDMSDHGVKRVVMEVSSHALMLKRVEDITFKSTIFTNLSHDHLDFHKTMENYYLSKLKLFSLLETRCREAVIVNADDEYGKKIINDTGFTPVTYGIQCDADYTARVIGISMQGTRFLLLTPAGKKEVNIKLIGEFNVYNCLAAIAWGIEGGRSMEDVCRIISEADPVPGRLEIIKDEKSKKFVVIDYAHTPAALENVLQTLRSMVKEKLICVFGCGGDRDREKRPLMGKVAGIIADRVYLTSDNPRSEDAMSILLDIELGIRDTAARYFVIPDRDEAIKRAITDADENDCILIAGKGDEDYQIIGDKRIPFSDRVHALQWLSS